MIPVDLSQTVRVGSMIRTDPGSGSFGSDPGIHFRDPRTCLIGTVHNNNKKMFFLNMASQCQKSGLFLNFSELRDFVL